MHCTSCGQKNNEKKLFCASCGFYIKGGILMDFSRIPKEIEVGLLPRKSKS